MKKKLKDLTLEEVNKICEQHTYGDEFVVYCRKEKCPLWFAAGSCLRTLIQQLRYIEREVEIDESNDD